ncbi:GNAT family N-acetyltransferase [Candidatus Spongiihabitans sp.]|uniref:GNAT family N-acetyltransferase n=1 Tax=Candidatus Spongiihabitans sp. TaxID=3101308 RepID=UPI003C6EDA2A
MNEEILGNLWHWILDKDHEVEGFLAFIKGQSKPCGLAHVRRMPSPLRGADIGFLDDLFVAPQARGNNIGEALFKALNNHAKQKGWPKIRWITAPAACTTNYPLRRCGIHTRWKSSWNIPRPEQDIPQFRRAPRP